MSKTKLLTHSKNVPSLPGINSNRPSGAASIATSDDPEHLFLAVLYGERATRRLAQRKLKSKKYHKFLKQNGLI